MELYCCSYKLVLLISILSFRLLANKIAAHAVSSQSRQYYHTVTIFYHLDSSSTDKVYINPEDHRLWQLQIVLQLVMTFHSLPFQVAGPIK